MTPVRVAGVRCPMGCGEMVVVAEVGRDRNELRCIEESCPAPHAIQLLLGPNPPVAHLVVLTRVGPNSVKHPEAEKGTLDILCCAAYGPVADMMDGREPPGLYEIRPAAGGEWKWRRLDG